MAREYHQPRMDPAAARGRRVGAGQGRNGKLVRGDDGKPMLQAKYTGLHALRHFYTSWYINREADGGPELPAKVVQKRLGHSSITVTLDTYGHLFPRGDDSGKLAEAESRLWG
jgi:integrase